MSSSVRAVSRGSILLVALLVYSAAPAEEASPYRVDERDFGRTIRKVAVAPADAAQRVHMPDAVARLVEEEVIRLLDRKGYDVMPVSAYAAIQDRMTDAVGGLNDPSTGALDPDKAAAVRDHSFREMLRSHDMDGVVRIRVRHVGAPFAEDRAEWDGVKQEVEVRKEERGSPYRGKKMSGTIAASSVQVSVYDRNENLLYSAQGGVELVMRRAGPEFEELAPGQLFQDDKRLRNAVKLAVREL